MTVSVLFDTIKVPSSLKPLVKSSLPGPRDNLTIERSYLAIMQDALFGLGVRRSHGATLTYEEVIDQLNE